MTQTRSRDDTPISAPLRERRKFKPPATFVKRAVVNKASVYRAASKDPTAFWERQAKALHWFKPWKRVLQWKAPHAKWFAGGKLNVAYNCLDRHVNGPLRTKAASSGRGNRARRGHSPTGTSIVRSTALRRPSSGTASKKEIGSPSICR